MFMRDREFTPAGVPNLPAVDARPTVSLDDVFTFTAFGN